MHKVLHQQVGSKQNEQESSSRQNKTEEAHRSSKASSQSSTSFHHFCRISILPPAPPRIQPKLTVNTPGDKYEQEADRVAEQVMRMSTPSVQRKCTQCGHQEEEHIQRKPLAASISPIIQRKCSKCEEEEKQVIQTKSNVGTGGVTSPNFTNQIKQSSGTGQVMDVDTRSFMEARFGTDFSNVRIHSGGQSAQMNREIQAQAFTHGSDIYFNSGKYDPNSSIGKKLLAHELTHVVQQRNERTPVVRRSIERYLNWDAVNKYRLARQPRVANAIAQCLQQSNGQLSGRMDFSACNSIITLDDVAKIGKAIVDANGLDKSGKQPDVMRNAATGALNPADLIQITISGGRILTAIAVGGKVLLTVGGTAVGTLSGAALGVIIAILLPVAAMVSVAIEAGKLEELAQELELIGFTVIRLPLLSICMGQCHGTIPIRHDNPLENIDIIGPGPAFPPIKPRPLDPPTWNKWIRPPKLATRPTPQPQPQPRLGPPVVPHIPLDRDDSPDRRRRKVDKCKKINPLAIPIFWPMPWWTLNGVNDPGSRDLTYNVPRNPILVKRGSTFYNDARPEVGRYRTRVEGPPFNIGIPSGWPIHHKIPLFLGGRGDQEQAEGLYTHDGRVVVAPNLVAVSPKEHTAWHSFLSTQPAGPHPNQGPGASTPDGTPFCVLNAEGF